MREILFKGKRIDNGEWAEGNLILSNDTDKEFKAIIVPKNNSGMFLNGSSILSTNDEFDLGFENWYLVDPETICQYTGLTDRRGNKIFDGDILSAHLDDNYPEDITHIQISWDGFSWCVRESLEDVVMTEYDCNIFEVCGNIFENPEILPKYWF